jgi:hypothetical protein
MTIYVDKLHDWGWVLRGHVVPSCHMFTDNCDLTELHDFAAKIGMKRRWFQPHNKTAPHYDLTAERRADAVKLGAVEVDRHEAVRIWRTRRKAIEELANHSSTPLAAQPNEEIV